MTPAELRAWLRETQLTQAELGSLVDASVRSVSAWTAEGGSVPGPVAAYARLFSNLPDSARQLEVRRLRGEKATMRDGMYLISYASQGNAGWAVLTFDRGAVYGFDPMGGRYDGVYLFDTDTATATATVQVTIPAGIQVVWGPAKPYTWSFEVTATLLPYVDVGHINIMNSLGPDLTADYRFVRPLAARSSSGIPFLPVPHPA